jgi:hypothetical protein
MHVVDESAQLVFSSETRVRSSVGCGGFGYSGWEVEFWKPVGVMIVKFPAAFGRRRVWFGCRRFGWRACGAVAFEIFKIYGVFIDGNGLLAFAFRGPDRGKCA